VSVQCLDEVVKDVAGLVRDCKFSGLGSITGCSIVVNRAAGMVVWSLYVSAIGVDVGT
jgi:hypothetical protein